MASKARNNCIFLYKIAAHLIRNDNASHGASSRQKETQVDINFGRPGRQTMFHLRGGGGVVASIQFMINNFDFYAQVVHMLLCA